VLIVGLAMGYLMNFVDRSARAEGSLAACWIAAVVITMTLSSIVELRFLWLETPLYLLSGLLVFSICERRIVSGVKASRSVAT
ncbi:MAG: hypothetical protein ACRDLS_11125, partial [Solirubrobacteraceae bacterium]